MNVRLPDWGRGSASDLEISFDYRSKLQKIEELAIDSGIYTDYSLRHDSRRTSQENPR